jgi:hypothetical protein
MSRIVKDHRPAVRFCEPRPKRVLLCSILDIDISPIFDDLTILNRTGFRGGLLA